MEAGISMSLKRTDRRCQSGVTLVELMIYMVFAFVVISFALNMTNAASKGYVRGREISKVQSNGRYAMAILARDVMNTGFKSILSTETGVLRVKQFDGTWTGKQVVPLGTPADSGASFLFSKGDPGDTLEIFKAELNSDGTLDQVVRARYHLDKEHVMWRITQIYDPGEVDFWRDGDTLALSKNIEAFQCRFSIDGINWNDDPNGNRNKIQAIQLEILMRTEREVSGPTEQSYSVGDITFTPPAGDAQYMRRRYLETVEVVNNGVLF